MREVYVVSLTNTRKAEEALKNDDLVGRQSIFTRGAQSLGMKGENFIIIDGSEVALKKAAELLKGLAEKAKNKDEVLKKFDEIENQSASGLGSIFG
jgi:predicted peroxiredoxin